MFIFLPNTQITDNITRTSQPLGAFFMVNPCILGENLHLFIKLMVRYGIKPKDIGIMSVYKSKIKIDIENPQ